MQDIKYAVHAHPTLSEVIDELFKSAKVISTTSSNEQDKFLMILITKPNDHTTNHTTK